MHIMSGGTGSNRFVSKGRCVIMFFMSFTSTKKHTMTCLVRNEVGLLQGDSATDCVTFATSHVDNSERIDPSHAIGVSGISTGSAGGAFFN